MELLVSRASVYNIYNNASDGVISVLSVNDHPFDEIISVLSVNDHPFDEVISVLECQLSTLWWSN